jgi:hypothetical protein
MRRVAAVLPVAALLAATLKAQDVPPAPDVPAGAFTMSAELAVVSRYVWRGYELSRGAASVQPWLTLDHRSGFGLNLFSASALDRSVELDEAQLGAHFAFTPRAGWGVDVGYLTCVMPGTETEPGAGADPLALTTSSEAYLAVTRPAGAVAVTMTLSRGFGLGRGTSINLWLERAWALRGETVTATPYVQVDYLDQYGAPRSVRDRVAALEAGVPVSFALGATSVTVAAHLTWVTSPYVRAGNAAAGSGHRLLPWLSIGVSRGS